MAALSTDRNTPRLAGDLRQGAMGAQKVYAGGMIARNLTGHLVKAAADPTLVVLGRTEEQVDNAAGAAGDKQLRWRPGTYRWDNSAADDEITGADLGEPCYAVDDHTVAKTAGDATRPLAGVVVGVDGQGVHVEMGEAVLAAARARGKVYVPVRVATLVGANSYYVVAPVAGRVTKIRSITEGVLTTGDATLTAKINGAAITNGAITIAQAGSAAGDVDEATPTAANVVAAGDKLAVTVGGSNATASVANVVIEISL